MAKSFDDFEKFLFDNYSSDMAIDTFQLVKDEYLKSKVHIVNPELENLLITASKAVVQVNLKNTFTILKAYHHWRENP